MADVELLFGDCLDVLKSMESGSVDCVVTSPPYYGLRDYGHEGQLGLEKTPEEFVANLVAVFAEVKRVLKNEGTVWLVIGDSYATKSGKNGYGDGRNNREERRSAGVPNGIKPKDLIGIPWRVAFALQADGWFLRQDIIWHKPNPMTESVTDRCTKSHEYVFLLTKRGRYFYDHEAVKEPLAKTSISRLKQHIAEQEGSARANGGAKTNGNLKAVGDLSSGKRNKRDVWTVTTVPYAGAHFATFPPELIRPCIKAGCPAGGVVLDPFGGSGTTGQVALEENRNAILIELNPKNEPLMRERLARVQPELVSLGGVCGV